MLATFGWALLSTLLLLIAFCSLVSYQPKSMGGIAGYWALSIIGQSFAPQLGILSLLLISAFFAFNTPLFSGITAVLSLLLYSYIYWRGRASQGLVNALVNKAIDRLPHAEAPKPNTTNMHDQGFLPVGLRPLKFGNDDVLRTKDISYGPHGSHNLLDIYQPKIRPTSAMPVFVFIPGGAWVTGSKNDQGLPLLNHLAKNGWLCVAINYRLGPKSRFPAMLEDIFNAIRWVKSHAHDYGGDSSFLALSGNSAGGHLSSITALAQPSQLAPLGINRDDIDINVVVSIYGRYDFLNRHHILPGTGLEPFLVDKVMPCTPTEDPELWDLASPESLVHASAPPFLMVHGSADVMIPVQEARAFYSALQNVSHQAVDYLEIPGAQHAYDLTRSSWAMPTVYGINNYLNAHYNNHLQSRVSATSSQN